MCASQYYHVLTLEVVVPLPQFCGWLPLRPRSACIPCLGRWPLHKRTVRRPRPRRPRWSACIYPGPCSRLRIFRPSVARHPWTKSPGAPGLLGPGHTRCAYHRWFHHLVPVTETNPIPALTVNNKHFSLIIFKMCIISVSHFPNAVEGVGLM